MRGFRVKDLEVKAKAYRLYSRVTDLGSQNSIVPKPQNP